MTNYPIPYKMEYAEKVQAMVEAGVSVSVIYESLKDLPQAPRSYTTFYKLYRGDIVTARARLHQVVGSKIVEKAKDGDMQALTLIAKTKMGWNEKLVVEVEDPGALNEDTSAIDDLIAALNLKEQAQTEE